MAIVGWVLAALAGAAVAYTLLALAFARRLDGPGDAIGVPEPVTLLKPLHGAEPRLAANLATFLDQDWEAPIQLVAGVQREDDPAIAALATLQAGSGVEVGLVRDATRHGANGKISNLLNMAPAARHGLLVLSDSDMAAPRDYLARLAGALARPGTGAVTCLYLGRGDAGPWSRLAAAGISYGFLPQLLVGLGLGLARPGMGSTIALRAETLEAVGGFAPLADALADDYALGEAVRGLGLSVAVPPMLLVHGCDEGSLRAVWRHELRWCATILSINPGGQVGTLLTHPLPLALLAVPFAPRAGAVAVVAALAARLALKLRIDRAATRQAARWAEPPAPAAPAWVLPARDILSFAVFVAAFFVRSVDWRGGTLRMEGSGRVSRPQEPSPP